jgi:hypothetical protein
MTQNNQICLLKNSEEHFNWLLNYSNTLTKIKEIINEIKDETKTIIFAIDFYDILLYSFPFIEFPVTGTKDEKTINEIVTNYLARSFIIDYYQKPKVILPPYIDELNGYLNSFSNFVNKLTDSSIANLSNKLTILFNQERTSNIKKRIAEEYRDINNYLMLVYDTDDGRSILASLFDKTQTNQFQYLQDFEIDKNTIYNILISDNDEIEKKFNKIRTRKDSINQNITDSKAIQLIHKLNSQNLNYLFFLVSGARSMNDFFEEYPEYNHFISLNFFKVLIELTYNLNQNDPDYYDNILSNADSIINEVTSLYGENLKDFELIFNSCPVLVEKRVREKNGTRSL